MRQLKRKAALFAKRVHTKMRRKTHEPRFIHQQLPYFSQWESRELVEKIITKQIEAKDDPRWRESGAESVQEYTSWSWSCCGMACLKMVLAHKTNEVVPLVMLGKQCVQYDGYRLPLESHPGLYYKPFVRFIKEEYGLDGVATSTLTLTDIKNTLSNGGYVIASVTPEIRFPAKDPVKKGGHLVLIFGYDDLKQVVYLHNPSGFKNSQEGVELSYSRFRKFFDNKGIMIR